MSQITDRQDQDMRGFPRSRGDEPQQRWFSGLFGVFSPLTRG